MIPYNRSKIVGANPFIVRNGQGYSTEYGLNIIGINEPAQASGFTDGSAAAALNMGPDMPSPPIFRWKPIVAMVTDWPWATDEIDTPFDQSNLLALRTRCCIVGEEGDIGAGGEVNWWTAVPKVLPVGFTPRGRAGIIGGIGADHLGDFPAYGPVTWDPYYLQYSTREIKWREPLQINGAGTATYTGYGWVPCNLSRVSLPIAEPTYWYGAGGSTYNLGLMREVPNAATGGGPPRPPLRHLGFRGGRFESTGPGAGPYAPAGTVTVSVAYSDTDAPASMADVTVLWSEDITTAAAGYRTIGSCLAPLSAGATARKYWFCIVRVVNGAIGNRSSVYGDPRMSPRTDIPAWFTAITGNKVAPGGTI